jgi:signal transduction histidine kinase/CHASE3 domain sensor protein/CheY-like chemotaxis protein
MLKRANTLAMIGIAVLTVTVFGLTWARFDNLRSARQWVRHSYVVLGASKDLQRAIVTAENSERGYLLLGEERFLPEYDAGMQQVDSLHTSLTALTSDNAAQQVRLSELAPLLHGRLDRLSSLIELRHSGGLDAAKGTFGTGEGRALMVRIRALLGDFDAEEARLLDHRLIGASEEEHNTRWLALTGTVLAVALLGVAGRGLSVAVRERQEAEAKERRAAERMRTSINSLSQGVGVFGPELELEDWNGCLGALLGVEADALRAGMSYAELFDLTSRPAPALLEDMVQLHHTRSAGQRGVPIVYERTNAAGQTLELRRTALPSGGFVVTISDLTEHVRAEAMLRQAQKMEVVGQLTGGVAHDFNNLLTVMIGNLEYVRGRVEEGGALAIRLDRAMWAARRGATLTSHLLAFARRSPLAPQPTDLSATVPALLPLLQRTLGEHINIRFVDAAGLWPVLVDSAQLESAILNLCLNARDAMALGGRLTIELANKVLDEDYARGHSEVTAGDYAMVAVSDTGHGMTPEVLAHVFEPFFTTKPVGQGTGLGLAMVFGFAKQSGGHVKIYSEPGQGTTVKLYLPRAIGAVIARVGRREPADLPRGSAAILLVEDDAAVREVTAAALRDLGYCVFEAGDGEEALRVAAASVERCDLLLLDVVLPGALRGPALAERIAAIWPDVKVLYMSGYTENAIIHHGRLDDGVALIGKPFQREALARRVMQILRGTESARAASAQDANADDSKARRFEAG